MIKNKCIQIDVNKNKNKNNNNNKTFQIHLFLKNISNIIEEEQTFIFTIYSYNFF